MRNLSLKLLGAAHTTKSSEAVVAMQTQPEFRRATEAMRMAYAACLKALDDAKVSAEEREKMLVLIGTAYGELEVTKDFLKDWYTSKLARPMSFQNSLHNAVLGFLSIQLRLRGPGLTLSNGARTPRDLFEAAQVLLQTSESELCLVCHVDSYMQKMREDIGFNGEPVLIAEGASAIVLTRENSRVSQNSEAILPAHFQSWAL